jgi:hypothetical protein
LWREQVADFGQSIEHLIEGSGANPSKVSFQFGEGHFDRIEIRAVTWLIEEPATDIFQSLGGILVGMRRQVVTDYDGSRHQFWRKDSPNACGKGFSIHSLLGSACSHARKGPVFSQGAIRVSCIAERGQTRDECLRAPSAEGRGHFQGFATQAAPSQAGQVGFDRSFINKYRPVRMRLHFRDAIFESFLSQMFYPCAQPRDRSTRLQYIP